MTAHIRVRDVTLTVPLLLQRERSAKTMLGGLFTAATSAPVRTFRTILEGVTFEAQEGDRVALIGRNGAGKSTLLSVLTGIYIPTSGVVDVKGSRQALLNISLGFNKAATVRENIFLRGTAMGLSSRQIRTMVDSILEFSELADVAQHELHTLSSGQKMRLGFAISTSVDQDIILLDEWLGAGDSKFRERARTRMNDRVRGSKIVILASHDNELLKNVCNKGLLLHHGKPLYYGPINSALDRYRKQVA